MTVALARHGAMPKKTDDSVSPYLRRRLRKYEEVARNPEEGENRPDRSKAPEQPVTQDPAERARPDEPNDR